MFDEITANFQ